jgi:hypothetical protein
MRAEPAQWLELPVPRRAGEQLGTERHAARCGPLQLAHRADRRADSRREPCACRAPLGARDCRSQPAARKRRGELVVLGQLRGDDQEQLGGQIEQRPRPIGVDIVGIVVALVLRTPHDGGSQMCLDLTVRVLSPCLMLDGPFWGAQFR